MKSEVDAPPLLVEPQPPACVGDLHAFVFPWFVSFDARSFRAAVDGLGADLLGRGAAWAADPDPAALIKNLKAEDVKQRVAAVDGLADMGPEARSAGPALAPLLKDPSPEVRWRTARAIASVGHAGSETAAALVADLADDDPRVRAYAAFALGSLEIKTPAVISAIGAQIADPDPLVRRTAFRTLRKMDLPSSVTVPLWVKTMATTNPDAAMAAAQTLAEGGEKSVAFLRAALADPKAAYWACLALAEIGPPAKDATPDIAKLLTSAEPNVRLEASMALGAIGARPRTPCRRSPRC